MRFTLTVVLCCAAAAASAGEVRFGDKSLQAKASDHVLVIGPDTRIERYTKARTAAFEKVDPEVVEKMKGEVLISLPWQLIGGGARVSKPTKLVFTTKGTRDVVHELAVSAEAVPLSNAFGKESVGYEGAVIVSLTEFQILDAELDIHVVHDAYTFTDKWKKAYYAKALKK